MAKRAVVMGSACRRQATSHDIERAKRANKEGSLCAPSTTLWIALNGGVKTESRGHLISALLYRG